MPPAGLDSGYQENQVAMQLGHWAGRDGRGVAFGSSIGFILPNRAGRSPDACWISNAQLARLDGAAKSKFPHLCPELIIEVISPSDRLKSIQAKMDEWIDNGAQLAWLIDSRRTVTVYRPGREPEELASPEIVAGEGPVEGFQFDARKLWRGL